MSDPVPAKADSGPVLGVSPRPFRALVMRSRLIPPSRKDLKTGTSSPNSFDWPIDFIRVKGGS